MLNTSGLVKNNHSLNNTQILGFAAVKDTAENARQRFATPIKNMLQISENNFVNPFSKINYTINTNICMDLKAFLQGCAFKGCAFQHSKNLFCCIGHLMVIDYVYIMIWIITNP